MINEEGLRDWFGKSKSKDGKKGWVNVVTGDSCASDKPGEGVPKCVSSAKRASMSKKERVAAQAAKRREDPGQQSKSGAAKPTNVKTDRKVKEDMEFNEAEDKKSKGSGKKDACYHKVKSRYSVWPSAYASGALVKCRKKGAKNWGNSEKKEEYMALPEMTDTQIKVMRETGIEVHVFNENMRLIKEKEVKVKDTRRTVDAIRAYDRSKDASRDATYDTDHGKKKKGDKEKAYAKKERGEIDKDDPNWKHKKYHTGMHGESVDIGEKIRADRERIEENRLSDEALDKAAAATLKRHKEQGYKVPGTGAMDDVRARIAARKKVTKEELEAVGLEEAQLPNADGNIYMVTFSWRGKLMYMKIFFPEPYGPTPERVEYAMNKIYPGAKVRSYDMAFVNQGDAYLNPGTDEGGSSGKK